MVAELAGISTSTVRGKTTARPENHPVGGAAGARRERERPAWILTATREPIYSVLDGDDDDDDAAATSDEPRRPAAGHCYPAKSKIVVISAVRAGAESSRADSKPEAEEETKDEQRELPYVWLPSRDDRRTTISPILEVADEDTLYSVVRKPTRKVRLPSVEASSSVEEEAIRLADNASSRRKNEEDAENVCGEGRPEGGPREDREEDVAGRRVEVRKWLGDAQLPYPPDMYSADRSAYEGGPPPPIEGPIGWSDRENHPPAVALPRGVVGLVGPYRVYGNPNERREYMLQEEELVEETLETLDSSASEGGAARREGGVEGEHRPRAKWKIREGGDNGSASLREDARDRAPRLGGIFAEMTKDDRKNERDSATTREMEEAGCVEGILSGEEERPVDVPDTASAVSTTPVREKWGEEVCLTTVAIIHIYTHF